MNGKFLIGVMSGGLMVAGAFVLGSALFPVVADRPADASAPAAQPTVASETAPETAPETATETVAEPASEMAAATPAAAGAAPADPATVAAPATEVAKADTPATAPEAAPKAAANTAQESSAEAPAEPAAQVGDEASTAAAATAGVTTEPDAPGDSASDSAETAPAAPTAEPSPATETAPQATEDPQPVVIAEAPTVPPEADPVAETAPEPPAEATPPAPPPLALALPRLDADAVLAALDHAGTTTPPAADEPTTEPGAAPAETALVETAEAAPATQPPLAEAPAAEPAAEPAPVADPAPAPEGMVPAPIEDADDGTGLPGAKPDALPDAGSSAPEPEVAAVPEAPEVTEDSTFKPAPGLEGKSGGVIVGRLPRIGDAPTGDAVPADALDPDAAPDAAPAIDPRPIAQFAATFENPEAKPLLALVLIDPGTADLDRAGLAALPFAVSFALDPLDPATPERAAIYRAAGREVVMLATGIAEGAQASDIEVAFQSMAQGLPEAVAVMDLADPLFQNRRPLASLVVPVVAAQGRGLLTWDEGLNAADQVARREDVPAAVVFRDLVSGGTDSEAIRRVLDRAVFKAGQDGRAVVAGTASPDTVAALLEWTVEGRAATVAIAPLTAVLTVE